MNEDLKGYVRHPKANLRSLPRDGPCGLEVWDDVKASWVQVDGWKGLPESAVQAVERIQFVGIDARWFYFRDRQERVSDES